MVITSLSRSEGPRFEPGWNHLFIPLILLFFFFFPSLFFYHTSLPFTFLIKKQRREVSINRPASYEPAALPLRHPAIHIFFLFFFTLFFLFFTFYSVKSSITGNRTRGTNVRGLYVTNYTIMDFFFITFIFFSFYYYLGFIV